MKRIRFPRLMFLIALLTAGGAALALGGLGAGTAAEAEAPVLAPGVLLAAGPPLPGAPPDGERHDRGERRVHVFHGHLGPWLGVQIAEVTEETVSELGLDRAFGVLVKAVEDESPADRAGIREDDVIVSLDGDRVPGTTALRRMVRETPAGRSVELGLIRDGRHRTVQVEIEERPPKRGKYWVGSIEDDELIEIPEIDIPHIEIPDIEIPDLDIRIPHIRRLIMRGPRLGVAVDTLTPQLAEHFGVRDGEGVLVKEVVEETPAERAGLRAGDVIVRVADRRIEDVGDLREELREYEGETVTLTIVRDRSERRIEVTLDKPERIHKDEQDSRYLREKTRRGIERARAAQREAVSAYREAVGRYRAEQRELRQHRREIRKEQRKYMNEWLRSAELQRRSLVQI
jgi:membrane-associated protease RseP (regulator of RpoE activity)